MGNERTTSTISSRTRMEPPDDADTLKGDTEHCTPPRCPLQADSNYWSAACGAAIWIYLRKGAPVARVTSWTRWRVCRRLRGGARRFNEEFQASVPADSSARRTPLKRGFEGMLLEEILRLNLGCLKVLSTEWNHLGDRWFIALESSRRLRPYGDVANRCLVTARNEVNSCRCRLTHCSSLRRTERASWGLGHCWPSAPNQVTRKACLCTVRNALLNCRFPFAQARCAVDCGARHPGSRARLYIYISLW